jgi:hypothetical protein
VFTWWAAGGPLPRAQQQHRRGRPAAYCRGSAARPLSSSATRRRAAAARRRGLGTGAAGCDCAPGLRGRRWRRAMVIGSHLFESSTAVLSPDVARRPALAARRGHRFALVRVEYRGTRPGRGPAPRAANRARRERPRGPSACGANSRDGGTSYPLPDPEVAPRAGRHRRPHLGHVPVPIIPHFYLL